MCQDPQEIQRFMLQDANRFIIDQNLKDILNGGALHS